MKLAEAYMKHPSVLNIPKWKYLIPACGVAMTLTAVMGWGGFPWRLYNDIPSLIGYTSLALIVYKIRIVPVNKFFSYTNRFSYEWYLVHILVFQVVMHFSKGMLPWAAECAICLFLSYSVALWYGKLWNRRSKA